MQPWSYNNSRRSDFASAIHRINTPMTQWPRIPVPISWSVQLNIDLYINTWAFFAGPSDFVTVIDVRRPLRWERGRTTVPWLHDNTWNFIVDKINMTAVEYTSTLPFAYFLNHVFIDIKLNMQLVSEVMHFVQARTDRPAIVHIKASTQKVLCPSMLSYR